jgi:hypothetical protein
MKKFVEFIGWVEVLDPLTYLGIVRCLNDGLGMHKSLDYAL